MVGVLFDSDDPAVLLQPFLAGCRVATYADLLNPTLVKEFGSRLIVIDRGHGDPLGLATVADIEPGLLTPAAGAAKIRQWISERRPTPAAYHDRNDWGAVTTALQGAPARHWVATLDGTVDPLGQRPAGVQILREDKLGFHADLSIVWDETWHPVTSSLISAEVTRLHQLAAAAKGPAEALLAYISGL